MATTAPDCPRCSSTMEDGFIIDKAHHSIPQTQKWVQGPYEYSFWKGLRLRDKTVFEVTTFRCIRCGYLESYATVPAKS